MTLTIELSRNQEERLEAAARRQGLAPEELARKLFDEHLPPVTEEQDPTLALFAKWANEDARKTTEEVAKENQMWEEFEKGINAARQEQGMRQL